jgi:ABC-type Mn2+/Zn2+ transport system permease subunit
MTENLIFLLIVGGVVGAAAGYMGSFMVLKRMGLVGDALSHVALPGMAIAIALNISPILGAFVALILAVTGVWYMEKTSRLYPEALVGIFFTASLAIGILITPEPDLLEALFGTLEKISFTEGLAAIGLSMMVLIVASAIAKKLILGVISEELAKSVGVATEKINLIYLLLVGMVVALGVRFVGSLLMGALVIIPAASAKNISRGMSSYYFLSMLFGVVSAMAGVAAASYYHISSGPLVVLASVLIFLVTYSVKAVARD